MTRRKWTTDAQGNWLAGHLDTFVVALSNKTTRDFFPKIIKDWHEAWPVPDPTPEEVAKAKNIEDAIKKKKNKEEIRVRAWFHNHTRGQTYGSGTRGMLRLQGKTRIPLEWQVYQQMTYESKWKPIIDKEWGEIKNKWEEENPEMKMTKSRFNFMNTFLQEKYNQEPDDIKNQVRKRREEMKEEGYADKNDVGNHEKNKSYQKAIDGLQKTLATLGEQISNATGWNISFLVGGPEPRQNGEIMTYILHCGNGPDNKNFEEYLGESRYDEHIIGPFDDFLYSAFPEEVRDSRSFELRESTPGDAEYTESNSINDEGNEAGTQAREGNIADIFQRLKEKHDLTKKKKTKGKKDEEDCEHHDDQTQTLPDNLVPDSATFVDSAALASLATSTPTATGTSVDSASLATSTTTVNNPDKEQLVPDSGTSVDSAVSASLATSTTTQAVNNSDTEQLVPDSSISVVTAAPASIVTFTPTVNDGLNGGTPLPAQSLVANDQDGPGLAESVAMDVDEGNDTSKSSITADTDASKAPAWLTSSGMLDYLCGISEEKAWQNLIASFLKFEMENTTTGNLPTTSRPEEIAAWMKSKRKDTSPDINADTYGSSFMAWWIAIQPKWRLADDSSFVYSPPTDEDWHLLHKGGSAGLYTVIVALSWWVKALTPADSAIRAWTAVHDVQWVIGQIHGKIGTTSIGKKQGRQEAAQSGRGKRHHQEPEQSGREKRRRGEPGQSGSAKRRQELQAEQSGRAKRRGTK